MTVTRIYLDMDGVACDFVKASLALFGTTFEKLRPKWPEGEYWMHTVLGISEADFWYKLDGEGIPFWSDLAPYPWFDEFYSQLMTVAPITFCTSPGISPSACAGKLLWLQEHVGVNCRDFVLTPQKHLLAAPGTVLIDDDLGNCQRFTEHGGAALAFPQHWNGRVGDFRTVLSSLALIAKD